MITAIDTSILLDFAKPEAAQQQLAQQAIRRAVIEGTVMISEVVYAETAAAFADDRAVLDELLEETTIEVTPLGRDAAYAAGLIFAAYRRAGGPRHHILADFLIAAHALHHADRLLTRDRGFYRAHFPDLTLFEPSRLDPA